MRKNSTLLQKLRDFYKCGGKPTFIYPWLKSAFDYRYLHLIKPLVLFPSKPKIKVQKNISKSDYCVKSYAISTQKKLRVEYTQLNRVNSSVFSSV